MSAQVTEAHRELARNIMFYHTPKGSATAQGVRDAAQLIADSEAKATAELRGALALGQQNCDDVYDDLRTERDQLRAEVERLKSDGAASAFVNMSCRASRAETERNNLRADLDAIKAILTEKKDRAERAEAKLAAMRELKRSIEAAL